MQFTTTVTQKGQVTLPISFRKQLNINPYDKVILNISPNKKSISVEPTEDILDLAGTFVPNVNKNKSVLEARNAMETSYKRV